MNQIFLAARPSTVSHSLRELFSWSLKADAFGSVCLRWAAPMRRLRNAAAVLLVVSAATLAPDVRAKETPENVMTEEELDSAPTAVERKIINSLTPDQIKRIDEVLLANITPHFRKVALVVGLAMMQLMGQYPRLPDIYYSGRIAELVAAGKLQSQGNLRRMRFSEVRTTGA